MEPQDSRSASPRAALQCPNPACKHVRYGIEQRACDICGATLRLGLNEQPRSTKQRHLDWRGFGPANLATRIQSWIDPIGARTLTEQRRRVKRLIAVVVMLAVLGFLTGLVLR